MEASSPTALAADFEYSPQGKQQKLNTNNWVTQKLYLCYYIHKLRYLNEFSFTLSNGQLNDI